MEKNQKAIFNATIRMEKDRRKKMEMGIFMITRILVMNADRQLDRHRKGGQVDRTEPQTIG